MKKNSRGCGGDNECAKLTVPLDYDHPDNGKTITYSAPASGTGDTLNSIVAKINAAGAGVTASINTGSSPSDTAHRLRIEQTALGMADVAVGSDTSGSVRIPAAFCGVAGVKPSRGRYPDDGML